MFLEWEDRKGIGKVNKHTITKKPNLGFEYAWIRLTDNTAMYVESHEFGHWNKELSEEDKQKAIDFINSYTPLVVEEPIKTLEELKKEKIQELNMLYEQSVNSLVQDVPVSERSTFSIQEKEALEYSANNSASIPFLKNLAQNRGISLDVLVKKVLEKSSLYSLAVGTLTGKRQKIEDNIKKANTKDELELIVIGETL